MFETYAPLLTTYWSQIVAVVVGFAIANVLRQISGANREKHSNYETTSKAPSSRNENRDTSTTTSSEIKRREVNGNLIERQVEIQTKLESCEPDEEDDIDNGTGIHYPLYMIVIVNNANGACIIYKHNICVL